MATTVVTIPMGEIRDGDVVDFFGLRVRLRGEPGRFKSHNSGEWKEVVYWKGLVLNPKTVSPALFNHASFYPDKWVDGRGWTKDYDAEATWIVQGAVDTLITVEREDA